MREEWGAGIGGGNAKAAASPAFLGRDWTELGGSVSASPLFQSQNPFP